MTILADALAHHQAGRLREAEALYRKIVADEPENGEALHLFGRLARESGQPAIAIELIRRAITLDAGNCELHNEHGMALLAVGELEEAERAFLRALQLRPRYVDAMLNLADLLIRSHRDEAAATCCRAALRLEPGNADAAGKLAAALHRLGQAEEALECSRLAAQLDPTDADRQDDLGKACLALDQPERAIEAHRNALALRPDHAETHYRLGNALARLDRLEEAAASFGRALELDPQHGAARHTLGRTLQELGRVEEALRCADEALAQAPDDAAIRCHRARLLLLLGRHEEGWAEHRWRWRGGGVDPSRRQSTKPLWDGVPQHGATLLVRDEPELDDTIQFVRYVAVARQRVGRLVLEVPAPLHPLVAGLSSIDELITTGDAVPPHDLQTQLFALPHLLGEAAGLAAAYLAADPVKARGWAERIGRHGQRVGILWSEDGGDRKRSIPGEALRPLLACDARFFSLQPGRQRQELVEAGLDSFAVDLSPDLRDLSETAAVLTALDLVITVDAAVAHLAGALGRPVWLLLPFAPDWRWGLTGGATRWYPQMRLFRQPAPGRWDTVISDVAQELTRLFL
jgi:tetratricopeptide (TPR) repeat protein